MAHSNSKSLVSGITLQIRLEKTTSPVKWITSSGETLGHVEPAQALIIVRAGVFEGKATHGRVYFIREVDPRPSPSLDMNYRDDRAVIHYHTDMRVSTPIHVRNRQAADCWDAMLRRDPAPRSWQRV